MVDLDGYRLKCDYCPETAVAMIGESNNILVCEHHGASEELLDRVGRASQDLVRARQEYSTSVWLAASQGYSNVQIARAARKTEAAIRMMLKRHGQRTR